VDRFQRHHKFCLDIAVRSAEMSHAQKRKTGCVIVANQSIISHGWNGMPTGYDNGCEAMTAGMALETRPEVLHAEENAIGKVAASTQSCRGADLYVTYAPCTRCARLIWRAGIRNVYYLDPYLGPNADTKNGLSLLNKVGIPTIRLDSAGAIVHQPAWVLLEVD
jgi:dCMP deaminase